MPKNKYRYEKVIKVNCSTCHKWINEKDVEFIDISEDIQGADELTFKCPICKQVKKSRRFG
jgi:endogenous inhibitor of DNA gyrase (YacG/DUF329 family)